MLNMKMAFRLWAAAILLLTALVISENTAVAIGECPAVGANTDCATVITIEDNGLSIQHNPLQGPYDRIEDTLVGVVNRKTTPLSSIELVSGLPIFAFDGDGICGLDPFTNQPYIPRPPCTTVGATTYEGPGVTFSNISTDFKRGTVNFGPPLAANGGTTYFSLEDNINANPNACAELINLRLATFITSDSRPNHIMNATFTPNGGVSLGTAAQNCGFDKFNWISEITVPAPVPYWRSVKIDSTCESTPQIKRDDNRLSANTPESDPPRCGWTYDPSWNSFPYYWDVNGSDPNHSLAAHVINSGTTLEFRDNPTDACLPATDGIPGGPHTSLECNVPTQTTGTPTNSRYAAAGSKLSFKTRLAGVRNSAPLTPVELGILFKWESTFNGFSGGISRTANLLDADPGIGTGGITITEVQDVTNYQYNGIAVTTVNGAPIAPTIAVSATPSKLWPPNKFMVPVTVSGTMTEPGGAGVNPSTAAYVVLDEYGLVQPTGAVTLGPDGSYSFTIQLQASRNGNDIDGRQYHITVSADDNVGNKGSSSTLVIVPHDQRSDPKH